MAAEIVLMHDQSRSNTEITYKIASRAAWLLGGDANERAEIFDQMKQLYAAWSTTVHSGMLPSKSKIDLDVADNLVGRIIRVILERGISGMRSITLLHIVQIGALRKMVIAG